MSHVSVMPAIHKHFSQPMKGKSSNSEGYVKLTIEYIIVGDKGGVNIFVEGASR